MRFFNVEGLKGEGGGDNNVILSDILQRKISRTCVILVGVSNHVLGSNSEIIICSVADQASKWIQSFYNVNYVNYAAELPCSLLSIQICIDRQNR